MPMMAIALPCRNGEIAACDIASVKQVLKDQILPPGFALNERRQLEAGSIYDIEIGGWNGGSDAVGGVTIYGADHSSDLWKLLLRLSAEAQMLLVGDALGAIGCLAASEAVAKEMPDDLRRDMGPPVITGDTNIALAAIGGEDKLEDDAVSG